ncbi:hypothetical protein C8J57DRAFT_1263029 [Mycena rebaudengoi]|nr:hypothetical protein C8J57DRAFT_1263029 [Mycena rebaudengoi]
MSHTKAKTLAGTKNSRYLLSTFESQSMEFGYIDRLPSSRKSTQRLLAAVQAVIGANGGVLEAAMSHGCINSTHVKRYRSDLVREGAVLGADADLTGMPPNPAANVTVDLPEDPAQQQQEDPVEGTP